MKHFKKWNFSLLIYMCDILFDFYERNELDHDVWERVEERDININSKEVSNV